VIESWCSEERVKTSVGRQMNTQIQATGGPPWVGLLITGTFKDPAIMTWTFPFIVQYHEVQYHPNNSRNWTLSDLNSGFVTQMDLERSSSDYFGHF
jgi:hypothetical protein